MRLDYKKFYSIFIPVFAGSLLVHFLLFRAFNSWGLSISFLGEVYLFLGLLTTVHFHVLSFLFKMWPRFAGFIFTGLSIFKMGISFLFLFPLIYPHHDNSISLALNFMAVYFVFLFVEVLSITKKFTKNH